jgi:hypothetical protein
MEINKISEILIDYIKKSEINNLEDFKAKLNYDQILTRKNRKIEDLPSYQTRVRRNSQDYVEIALKPSNLGSLALTLAYVSPGYGNPIEFRINPRAAYSKILVKHEKQIEGYAPFDIIQISQNIQEKKLNTTDLSDVLKELEFLKSFK